MIWSLGKRVVSLLFISFALSAAFSLANTHPAYAENVAEPFVSQKIRDEMIDYQQLTYTLECIPNTTMMNGEFDVAGIGEDMVFASNNQLSKQKILDQGILGASQERGAMFDNDLLGCDGGKDFGFVWPFANFGRPDLVDFFCSLPSVYHNLTGGNGKTIAGGANKAACKSGSSFTNGNSFFVAKKGANLRAEAKAEFEKSDRGKIAAKPLTNAKKYVQYWLSFNKGCGAVITGKYPTDSDPAANNGTLFRIPVVNQAGKSVDYIANTGGKSTDGQKLILDATQSAPGGTTCGELAIGMRQFAPAYSNYLKGPGKNDAGATDGTGIVELEPEEEDPDEKTSCAVDGIGWIICPVMNFMAKMNDKAFGFLQNLLTVRPALITDDGTKNAWGTFRDLANVAFVIAFLIIVYSQLTSVGVSNYGIKKLLPKIIIAAILVNLSYFICALLVDLSNIVGSSIYGLLANVVPTTGGASGSGGAGPWETIVAVILTGAVGLLLFFVLATSPFVLIALGIVLLILIARQAFVILLLVVSPLAFVAYLLPNTEDWFKKWWKALTATLMVYPIVGAIFGASTLASNILMNVANGSSGDDETLLKIVALTVLAVPLFAVPGVLKGSMAAAGTVGAKLQGLADRAQNRASSDVKGRSGEIAKNLSNRAAGWQLGGDSRTRRAASFLTGVRRRAKRQDTYKNRQALRDADQENFLNGPTDDQGRPINGFDGQLISKTARLRAAAAEAKKTADAKSQLIQNTGISASLQGNAGLHQNVARSNFAVHHQEEVLKNKGETSYLNHPANQEHYNELVKSREDRQAAETRAGNQAKQDGEVRRAIRENKVAKGEEKIIDQEIELEHQTSDTGRDQGKRTRVVEGELEIERTSQDAAFAESTEGKAQAIAKDVQVQRKATQEARNQETAILINEDLHTEAAAAKESLGKRETIVTSKGQQEFIESDAGKKLNLEAQTAKDGLERAKVTEDAIVKELRANKRDDAGNLVDADGNQLTVEGLSDAEASQFAENLGEIDVETRAQRQRAASADSVANVEYQKKVKASEGQAGGLAEIAGGIGGEAARERAVATATQAADKQLAEAVAAQKTTLESTTGDLLEAEYKTGFIDGDPAKGRSSPERLMAVAGTIAGRGYMGGKLELLRETGPALVRARADAAARGVPADKIEDDPAVQAVRYTQKQIAADLKEWPFGAGDTMRDRLALGEWEGDFDADFKKRIGKKLTGPKLGSLKIEEVAQLESIFTSLTPEEKTSLDAAVLEAQTSETVRNTVKPETWDVLERMGYSRPTP